MIFWGNLQRNLSGKKVTVATLAFDPLPNVNVCIIDQPPHCLHPSVHWAFALAMCADCKGPGREGTPYCNQAFQGGSNGESYVDKLDLRIKVFWPWDMSICWLTPAHVFGRIRPLFLLNLKVGLLMENNLCCARTRGSWWNGFRRKGFIFFSN